MFTIKDLKTIAFILGLIVFALFALDAHSGVYEFIYYQGL